MRCRLVKPKIDWFEEPLPAIFSYTEKADATLGVRALKTNVSFAVGQGCYKCAWFDNCRLTQMSELRSFGGVERLLDWSVSFS